LANLANLDALQVDITQTFATFSAFLNTLTPFPVPTNTVQQQIIPLEPPMVTTMTTTAPRDGYNDDSCIDDCVGNDDC